MSDTLHPSAPRRKNFFKLLVGLVLLGLVIGLVATWHLYTKTKQELQKLQTVEGQQEVAKKEIQAVVEKLGKLTLLPKEDPFVATITNSTYLATQSAFYKESQNGDKLIVFRDHQKAFIYSPERNVIVNSGPLIFDNNTTTTPQQTASPVNVEVRNGTTTAGVATKVKEQIESNGVTVATVTDAARKNYPKTQILAINPAVPAAQLAQFEQVLNGQIVSALPAGEATSSADVLIIVGQ